MYENETRYEILQRMLGTISDELDKREGSVVYDLLAPSAIELETMYQLLDFMLKYGFVDTSQGEFLTMLCSQMGVMRKPALHATGKVTLEGTDGLVLPIGTEVSTGGDNPLYFVTTEEYVFPPSLLLEVEVTCEVGGEIGNIATNELDIVIGDLASLVTVKENASFSGGVEEEDDVSLLERYYERVLRPVTSGNANHYLTWVKSVDGVGDAKVDPLHYGNGTVRIVVIDANKQPPSEALLQQVTEHVEAVRPVGANVFIEAAKVLPITVSATLTLADGVQLPEVQKKVEANVDTYLRRLAFKDPVVRISQIGNIIIDTEGVLDYEHLTVNDGTVNVQVPDATVAVRGVVTLV